MTDFNADSAIEYEESEITLDQALRDWVPFAYTLLKETAGRYNALITRDALATKVQELSGVSTDEPQRAWLNQVLTLCAAKAAADAEPPLASLCIRSDGSIGAAYAKMPLAPAAVGVEQATKTTLADLGNDVDLYAAEHRLLCYRTFAKNVPADAVATLPPNLAERRGRAANRAERQKEAARAEAPRPLCMGCFTELPATGVCSRCDA